MFDDGELPAVGVHDIDANETVPFERRDHFPQGAGSATVTADDPAEIVGVNTHL